MSAQPTSPVPPDPGSSWARAAVWGAVSGILFASLVIASWGFLSLGLDRDVVELPGVGVLVAPTAVAGATAVVGLFVALALRLRFRTGARALWLAAPTAVTGWLVFAISAGLAATASRPPAGAVEDAAQTTLPGQLALGLAVSPFGLAMLPLSALVVVAALLATARPDRGTRDAA